MNYKEENDDFLFGSSANENDELAFLNKESKNQDGIYRPSVKEAADPKVGYKATIRFLRNVYLDGSGTGSAAITKHVHYADFKDFPELSGYYDCEKNISDKTPCPLCTTYWKLAKSNNQADVEKSKQIKRNTKFYSYIMVIEDEQHPELIGKILVYPYGPKIKAKINAEKNGEVGEKCNIFDFVTGKDFRLIIKTVKTPNADGRGTTDMPNYDTSQFLASTPIKIWNEKTQKFVTPPTETDDDGKVFITDKKWQAKIKEVILNRPANVKLEDHKPSPDGWNDETRDKVDKILQILSGNSSSSAETSVKRVANRAPAPEVIEEESFDDLFDFDSDSDDDK